MSYLVDLRSDTVTTPSPAMRRAMADAEVGDDWYGDDPTVNRLQERAAELVGMEAACYVPTGTMANQIGLRLHAQGGGHLVLCETNAHVGTVEMMTSAVLAGIAYRTLDGPRGLTGELVAGGLEPDTFYDVEVVDVVAIENTLGGRGGAVMPIDEIRTIRKITAERGVPVHLDGARLFNASVAAEVRAAEYGAEVDTLMFCLSKGLGAPIGSLICGSAEHMREARRLKILYGGAWRQAGIVAAAGLVALENGPERLHEDHARARRLAERIADVTPGAVEPTEVETNMVFVDTAVVGMDPAAAASLMKDEGVGTTISNGRLRMVTHLGVDDADIEAAAAAWRRVDHHGVSG